MSEPTNRLEIDNLIPFASTVYWWLKANHLGFPHFEKDSRRYEQPYLAWQVVRKQKNPFFDQGTGFEGYLIGLCQSPEEALHQILSISQGILTSIYRQNRQDYGFHSRLMKTLTGDLSDPKAIDIWAAEFGAAVARLRPHVRRCREADQFRLETYRAVQSLPAIQYRACETDHAIEQVYSLILANANTGSRINVEFASLKPSEQDAWLVARCIGRFGHPLVREFLDMR